MIIDRIFHCNCAKGLLVQCNKAIKIELILNLKQCQIFKLNAGLEFNVLMCQNLLFLTMRLAFNFRIKYFQA